MVLSALMALAWSATLKQYRFVFRLILQAAWRMRMVLLSTNPRSAWLRPKIERA
jgi:hypothetical protein